MIASQKSKLEIRQEKYNYRFDVPKSKIKQVGRNVILDMGYPELFKYQVDRNVPLPPTGESSVAELVNEQ
jgi:hypothetical protein